jgi:putative transcriptional regulator
MFITGSRKDYDSGCLMDFLGVDKLKIAEVLRKTGFAVSEMCSSRPSCFDFVGRKDEMVVMLKIQADVGNFSLRDAQELEAISDSISASMLLISDKGRDKPLEDDTVYSRHDVFAVTPKTLENFVLNDISPLVRANPGGCYVEVDGQIVKRRRQELGLSVGKLARMAGVSRRTLYGYERDMAKASVQTAYNLVWALGVPVAKPINVLEKRKSSFKHPLLTKAKCMIGRNRLFYRIFRRFTHCDVTAVSRAPFDFVLNIPDARQRIIGGFIAEKEEDLDRRVHEISSFSKIVDARAILLTQGHEPQNDNVRCLQYDDLAKSANPQNLIVSAT